MSGRPRRGSRLGFVAALTAWVLVGSTASAAPGDDDSKKAQDSFQRGTKEFSAGDYRAAAQDFEEAYRLKPHHSPLWNAARSWQRAGEAVRAANLYQKYLREAPTGTKDRDVATTELASLTTKLGRIVAHASGPIYLKVDEAAADTDGNFVPPGEHTVSGTYEGKPVRKAVTVEAGQTLSVTLEPPPPPPVEKPLPPPPPPKPEGFHLPWVVVAVGGVLTLGAGGVMIWSGLDSRSKRDDFRRRFNEGDASLTQGDLDEGTSTQTRTNILIGVTAGLGALTGISALLVDWGGSKSGKTDKGGLAVQPSFGGIVVRYTH